MSLTPYSVHMPSFGPNHLPLLVQPVIAREKNLANLPMGGGTHRHTPQKGLLTFSTLWAMEKILFCMSVICNLMRNERKHDVKDLNAYVYNIRYYYIEPNFRTQSCWF